MSNKNVVIKIDCNMLKISNFLTKGKEKYAYISSFNFITFTILYSIQFCEILHFFIKILTANRNERNIDTLLADAGPSASYRC